MDAHGVSVLMQVYQENIHAYWYHHVVLVDFDTTHHHAFVRLWLSRPIHSFQDEVVLARSLLSRNGASLSSTKSLLLSFWCYSQGMSLRGWQYCSIYSTLQYNAVQCYILKRSVVCLLSSTVPTLGWVDSPTHPASLSPFHSRLQGYSMLHPCWRIVICSP